MGWLNDVFRKTDKKQDAIDAYNLGLEAKYKGEWQRSFDHNLKATDLNPDDQASWWNFAIAATALRNWPEARRAWVACGVTLEEGLGEVKMTPQVSSCVRLRPDESAEVVWGTRIDPARIRVDNVPLPESDRLYGDIILNDGAQEGTRTSNGVDYPVFDELMVWQRSSYSTYEVEVIVGAENAIETLDSLCKEKDIAYEDWGTVRVICAECSRGNPAEHICSIVEGQGGTRFGFASKSRTALSGVLSEWGEIERITVKKIDLAVVGLNG